RSSTSIRPRSSPTVRTGNRPRPSSSSSAPTRHRSCCATPASPPPDTPGTRTGREQTTIPGWLWAPAIAGIVFLLVPVVGMLSRIDVADLGEVILAEESRLALQLSLVTSATSAIISVLIGFPLGYLLAT